MVKKLGDNEARIVDCTSRWVLICQLFEYCEQSLWAFKLTCFMVCFGKEALTAKRRMDSHERPGRGNCPKQRQVSLGNSNRVIPVGREECSDVT